MKLFQKKIALHAVAIGLLPLAFCLLSVRAAHAVAIAVQNIAITPTFDTNGQPTYPYTLQYDLTTPAYVTATISNSSGTVIRTLITHTLQADESVSTATVVWNGQTDAGNFVGIGIYTLTVNATDASIPASTASGTQNLTVASSNGAIAGVDPQKLFEQSAFVYPNPVRNGQATFQYLAVRDNATITLKIYTIDGTLVRSETFEGLTAGSTNSFAWDATNQSGRGVGRGLYFYVLKEVDSAGTLQTVKKLAVIR